VTHGGLSMPLTLMNLELMLAQEEAITSKSCSSFGVVNYGMLVRCKVAAFRKFTDRIENR
jgi:hypothetical protein